MSLPLHATHLALGARMGPPGPDAIPLDYGDPLAEHRAVRKAAGLADRSQRRVWRAAGPDAARFLHGLLSNDIVGLAPGQGCYATFLTERGMILTDVVVHRRKDDFLLHAPPETGTKGLALLARFLVGDDATLEDLSGRTGILGVYGPRAREIASSLGSEPIPAMPDGYFTERGCDPEVPGPEVPPEVPPEVLSEARADSKREARADSTKARADLNNAARADSDEDTLLVTAASWTGEEGFEILTPATALAPLWERLLGETRARGGRPVGETALDTLRVEAGTPRAGVDFGDDTIPQQAGLEHAVSFTKGCYRGQEIVLRVRTRGHANRSLVGLLLSGDAEPLPPRGARIVHEGSEAGRITSAVFSPTLARPIALAIAHRTATTPGTVVDVDAAPPRTATVVPLPFYRRI